MTVILKKTLLRLSLPLGTNSGVTDTNYNNAGYARQIFDKSKYKRIKAIYYQATLQQVAVGDYQVWAQLVNDGGTAITGTELTATLGQFGQSTQISGDIKDNLDNSEVIYRSQLKTASGGEAATITCNLLIDIWV